MVVGLWMSFVTGVWFGFVVMGLVLGVVLLCVLDDCFGFGLFLFCFGLGVGFELCCVGCYYILFYCVFVLVVCFALWVGFWGSCLCCVWV